MGSRFCEAHKISKQFDDATLDKDVMKLKELVSQVEAKIENHDIYYRVAMYYSLATATSEIFKLEHPDSSLVDKDILQKELFYYRKALDLFLADELRCKEIDSEMISLIAAIYTNYGNTLEACGRKISAIEQYYKALEIYPSFAMAYGNLGLAYMHFAMFMPQNKGFTRDCLNHYAYQMLTAAIDSSDPNIHSEAKVYYFGHLALFDADYREYLKKDIVFPKARRMTKAEKNYREWCMENRLFLTPLNDLPVKDLTLAEDDLSLPAILTPVDSGIPVIIGMFNQLKQEYVSARYTYYDTLNYTANPHFSDKHTSIAETLEYAQFSLRIEKLKYAFKTLFGILDKIAFFLNEYYELGIKLQDVDFKSIWQSQKFGKNGYEYQNTLDISGNFASSSLYWIQREFEKTNEPYASHEFVRLKEIRNSLEHRYTIITMFTKDVNDITQNSIATYISETELYDLTFSLLKLVREAIICLSLCVSVEEEKKIEEQSADFCPTIEIHTVDDKFKV